MNEQLTTREDPTDFAGPVRVVMDTLETDPDALVASAVGLGVRMRRRRRIGSVAVLVFVLVVAGGLGSAALTDWSRDTGVARHGQVAGAPTAERVPTEPAGPRGLTARTGALYLSRLLPGTPTAYYGSDSESGRVEVTLSYEGHNSQSMVSGQLTDVDDVSVLVQDKAVWPKDSGARQDLFTCAGRWHDSCHLSDIDGGALLVQTAPTSSGCCLIRGDEVAIAQFLRPDGTLVQAYGRADMFSTDQLASVVQDPLWNLTRPPSAPDAAAAYDLAPWAPSGPIAGR